MHKVRLSSDNNKIDDIAGHTIELLYHVRIFPELLFQTIDHIRGFEKHEKCRHSYNEEEHPSLDKTRGPPDTH